MFDMPTYRICLHIALLSLIRFGLTPNIFLFCYTLLLIIHMMMLIWHTIF